MYRYVGLFSNKSIKIRGKPQMFSSSLKEQMIKTGERVADQTSQAKRIPSESRTRNTRIAVTHTSTEA